MSKKSSRHRRVSMISPRSQYTMQQTENKQSISYYLFRWILMEGFPRSISFFESNASLPSLWLPQRHARSLQGLSQQLQLRFRRLQLRSPQLRQLPQQLRADHLCQRDRLSFQPFDWGSGHTDNA